MVKDVEGFQFKLQLTLFARTERNLSVESHIVIDVSGTVHDVDARVADSADSRFRERRRIEPEFPVWEAGTSGGNAGVRAANHVDTRPPIGGPRDVEPVRRIQAARKRPAPPHTPATRHIPP